MTQPTPPSAGPNPGKFLGQKIGPLPVVAWVGIAAGGVALLLAWRGKQQSSGTTTDTIASGGDTAPADIWNALDSLQSEFASQSQVSSAQLTDVGTQVSDLSTYTHGVQGTYGQYSLAGLQAQLASAQTDEQRGYIQSLISQVANGFSGGAVYATGGGTNAVPQIWNAATGTYEAQRTTG